MSRGIWNGAVVAICIALVTESVGAQPAPAPAPATPPPPTAADPAPPPPAASPPAPGASAPTYPPPPPQGAPPQGYTYPPGYAYPPGYGYPPGYDYRGERRRRPRRSRGWMIAGFVLFGVSYVIPAMSGIVIGGIKREDCDCRDAYRMLIPIAGPLTLMHHDSDYNALNSLLVMDAVLQGAGLALSIFGIFRYIASANAEDEYSLRHPPAWSFNATPIPGGAYGALRLRL